MPRHEFSSRWVRTTSLSIALGILCVSAPAWAGELKFGSGELETDDDGKLTSTGRSAANNTVESIAADEEAWQVNVWAKIDKGAPGPVYFEFYRSYQGNRLSAHTHEYADYDGGKYLMTSFEIDRTEGGFTFGETVEVELIQIGSNDKRQVLAKAKLTLAKGQPASPMAGGSGAGGAADGDEAGEADDQSDQDIADGLADGSEDPGLVPPEPPPIEPDGKKGCHVDPVGGSPWALAFVFVLAATARRRNTRG